MLKIAKKTGLARENLYNSLSHTGNPTLHTVTKVVDALGYHLSLTPNTSHQTPKQAAN
jgi:probable addiction module antidote protein